MTMARKGAPIEGLVAAAYRIATDTLEAGSVFPTVGGVNPSLTIQEMPHGGSDNDDGRARRTVIAGRRLSRP